MAVLIGGIGLGAISLNIPLIAVLLPNLIAFGSTLYGTFAYEKALSDRSEMLKDEGLSVKILSIVLKLLALLGVSAPLLHALSNTAFDLFGEPYLRENVDNAQKDVHGNELDIANLNAQLLVITGTMDKLGEKEKGLRDLALVTAQLDEEIASRDKLNNNLLDSDIAIRENLENIARVIGSMTNEALDTSLADLYAETFEQNGTIVVPYLKPADILEAMKTNAESRYKTHLGYYNLTVAQLTKVSQEVIDEEKAYDNKAKEIRATQGELAILAPDAPEDERKAMEEKLNGLIDDAVLINKKIGQLKTREEELGKLLEHHKKLMIEAEGQQNLVTPGSRLRDQLPDKPGDTTWNGWDQNEKNAYLTALKDLMSGSNPNLQLANQYLGMLKIKETDQVRYTKLLEAQKKATILRIDELKRTKEKIAADIQAAASMEAKIKTALDEKNSLRGKYEDAYRQYLTQLLEEDEKAAKQVIEGLPSLESVIIVDEYRDKMVGDITTDFDQGRIDKFTMKQLIDRLTTERDGYVTDYKEIVKKCMQLIDEVDGITGKNYEGIIGEIKIAGFNITGEITNYRIRIETERLQLDKATDSQKKEEIQARIENIKELLYLLGDGEWLQQWLEEKDMLGAEERFTYYDFTSSTGLYQWLRYEMIGKKGLLYDETAKGLEGKLMDILTGLRNSDPRPLKMARDEYIKNLNDARVKELEAMEAALSKEFEELKQAGDTLYGDTIGKMKLLGDELAKVAEEHVSGLGARYTIIKAALDGLTNAKIPALEAKWIEFKDKLTAYVQLDKTKHGGQLEELKKREDEYKKAYEELMNLFNDIKNTLVKPRTATDPKDAFVSIGDELKNYIDLTEEQVILELMQKYPTIGRMLNDLATPLDKSLQWLENEEGKIRILKAEREELSKKAEALKKGLVDEMYELSKALDSTLDDDNMTNAQLAKLARRDFLKGRITQIKDMIEEVNTGLLKQVYVAEDSVSEGDLVPVTAGQLAIEAAGAGTTEIKRIELLTSELDVEFERFFKVCNNKLLRGKYTADVGALLKVNPEKFLNEFFNDIKGIVEVGTTIEGKDFLEVNAAEAQLTLAINSFREAVRQIKVKLTGAIEKLRDAEKMLKDLDEICGARQELYNRAMNDMDRQDALAKWTKAKDVYAKQEARVAGLRRELNRLTGQVGRKTSVLGIDEAGLDKAIKELSIEVSGTELSLGTEATNLMLISEAIIGVAEMNAKIKAVSRFPKISFNLSVLDLIKPDGPPVGISVNLPLLQKGFIVIGKGGLFKGGAEKYGDIAAEYKVELTKGQYYQLINELYTERSNLETRLNYNRDMLEKAEDRLAKAQETYNTNLFLYKESMGQEFDFAEVERSLDGVDFADENVQKIKKEISELNLRLAEFGYAPDYMAVPQNQALTDISNPSLILETHMENNFKIDNAKLEVYIAQELLREVEGSKDRVSLLVGFGKDVGGIDLVFEEKYSKDAHDLAVEIAKGDLKNKFINYIQVVINSFDDTANIMYELANYGSKLISLKAQINVLNEGLKYAEERTVQDQPAISELRRAIGTKQTEYARVEREIEVAKNNINAFLRQKGIEDFNTIDIAPTEEELKDPAAKASVYKDRIKGQIDGIVGKLKTETENLIKGTIEEMKGEEFLDVSATENLFPGVTNLLNKLQWEYQRKVSEITNLNRLIEITGDKGQVVKVGTSSIPQVGLWLVKSVGTALNIEFIKNLFKEKDDVITKQLKAQYETRRNELTREAAYLNNQIEKEAKKAEKRKTTAEANLKKYADIVTLRRDILAPLLAAPESDLISYKKALTGLEEAWSALRDGLNAYYEAVCDDAVFNTGAALPSTDMPTITLAEKDFIETYLKNSSLLNSDEIKKQGLIERIEIMEERGLFTDGTSHLGFGYEPGTKVLTVGATAAIPAEGLLRHELSRLNAELAAIGEDIKLHKAIEINNAFDAWAKIVKANEEVLSKKNKWDEAEAALASAIKSGKTGVDLAPFAIAQIDAEAAYYNAVVELENAKCDVGEALNTYQEINFVLQFDLATEIGKAEKTKGKIDGTIMKKVEAVFADEIGIGAFEATSRGLLEAIVKGDIKSIKDIKDSLTHYGINVGLIGSLVRREAENVKVVVEDDKYLGPLTDEYTIPEEIVAALAGWIKVRLIDPRAASDREIIAMMTDNVGKAYDIIMQRAEDRLKEALGNYEDAAYQLDTAIKLYKNAKTAKLYADADARLDELQQQLSVERRLEIQAQYYDAEINVLNSITTLKAYESIVNGILDEYGIKAEKLAALKTPDGTIAVSKGEEVGSNILDYSRDALSVDFRSATGTSDAANDHNLHYKYDAKIKIIEYQQGWLRDELKSKPDETKILGEMKLRDLPIYFNPVNEVEGIDGLIGAIKAMSEGLSEVDIKWKILFDTGTAESDASVVGTLQKLKGLSQELTDVMVKINDPQARSENETVSSLTKRQDELMADINELWSTAQWRFNFAMSKVKDKQSLVDKQNSFIDQFIVNLDLKKTEYATIRDSKQPIASFREYNLDKLKAMIEATAFGNPTVKGKLLELVEDCKKAFAEWRSANYQYNELVSSIRDNNRRYAVIGKIKLGTEFDEAVESYKKLLNALAEDSTESYAVLKNFLNNLFNEEVANSENELGSIDQSNLPTIYIHEHEEDVMDYILAVDSKIGEYEAKESSLFKLIGLSPQEKKEKDELLGLNKLLNEALGLLDDKLNKELIVKELFAQIADVKGDAGRVELENDLKNATLQMSLAADALAKKRDEIKEYIKDKPICRKALAVVEVKIIDRDIDRLNSEIGRLEENLKYIEVTDITKAALEGLITDLKTNHGYTDSDSVIKNLKELIVKRDACIDANIEYKLKTKEAALAKGENRKKADDAAKAALEKADKAKEEYQKAVFDVEKDLTANPTIKGIADDFLKSFILTMGKTIVAEWLKSDVFDAHCTAMKNLIIEGKNAPTILRDNVNHNGLLDLLDKAINDVQNTAAKEALKNLKTKVDTEGKIDENAKRIRVLEEQIKQESLKPKPSIETIAKLQKEKNLLKADVEKLLRELIYGLLEHYKSGFEAWELTFGIVVDLSEDMGVRYQFEKIEGALGQIIAHYENIARNGAELLDVRNTLQQLISHYEAYLRVREIALDVLRRNRPDLADKLEGTGSPDGGASWKWPWENESPSSNWEANRERLLKYWQEEKGMSLGDIKNRILSMQDIKTDLFETEKGSRIGQLYASSKAAEVLDIMGYNDKTKAYFNYECGKYLKAKQEFELANPGKTFVYTGAPNIRTTDSGYIIDNERLTGPDAAFLNALIVHTAITKDTTYLTNGFIEALADGLLALQLDEHAVDKGLLTAGQYDPENNGAFLFGYDEDGNGNAIPILKISKENQDEVCGALSNLADYLIANGQAAKATKYSIAAANARNFTYNRLWITDKDGVKRFAVGMDMAGGEFKVNEDFVLDTIYGVNRMGIDNFVTKFGGGTVGYDALKNLVAQAQQKFVLTVDYLAKHQFPYPEITLLGPYKFGPDEISWLLNNLGVEDMSVTGFSQIPVEGKDGFTVDNNATNEMVQFYQALAAWCREQSTVDIYLKDYYLEQAKGYDKLAKKFIEDQNNATKKTNKILPLAISEGKGYGNLILSPANEHILPNINYILAQKGLNTSDIEELITKLGDFNYSVGEMIDEGEIEKFYNMAPTDKPFAPAMETISEQTGQSKVYMVTFKPDMFESAPGTAIADKVNYIFSRPYEPSELNIKVGADSIMSLYIGKDSASNLRAVVTMKSDKYVIQRPTTGETFDIVNASGTTIIPMSTSGGAFSENVLQVIEIDTSGNTTVKAIIDLSKATFNSDGTFNYAGSVSAVVTGGGIASPSKTYAEFIDEQIDKYNKDVAIVVGYKGTINSTYGDEIYKKIDPMTVNNIRVVYQKAPTPEETASRFSRLFKLSTYSSLPSWWKDDAAPDKMIRRTGEYKGRIPDTEAIETRLDVKAAINAATTAHNEKVDLEADAQLSAQKSTGHFNRNLAEIWAI